MKVQPKRMVQAIDDLLAKTTDPYHRQILENFKSHYMAEVRCDLEGTLSTMVENPVYHEYGNARTDFPHPGRVAVSSKEENRAYYQFGFENGMSVFEIVHDRLMV